MNRPALVARIAAFAYGATAALHASGYNQVVGLTAGASDDVNALVPLLWLCVAAGLVTCGLVVAAVAKANFPQRRAVLVFTALFPIGVAVLQVVYLGVIVPVYLLGVVAVLTIAAGFAPFATTQPHSANV